MRSVYALARTIGLSVMGYVVALCSYTADFLDSLGGTQPEKKSKKN